MVRTSTPARGRGTYKGPTAVVERSLVDLLRSTDRALGPQQLRFVGQEQPQDLYLAGDLELVNRPCVAVVGTREVSEAGRARASRLARELVAAGVVVVSGLARGVDTAAMTAAIEAGGKVIGVIGTPLDKAYPAENAALQHVVYEEHLLLTPFPEGERVYRSNFPRRNRTMAAISHATIVVEASDTSGTLHQAAECQRLGRWLFILRSVAEDARVSWPARFLGQPHTRVLSETSEVVTALGVT